MFLNKVYGILPVLGSGECACSDAALGLAGAWSSEKMGANCEMCGAAVPGCRDGRWRKLLPPPWLRGESG